MAQFDRQSKEGWGGYSLIVILKLAETLSIDYYLMRQSIWWLQVYTEISVS